MIIDEDEDPDLTCHNIKKIVVDNIGTTYSQLKLRKLLLKSLDMKSVFLNMYLKVKVSQDVSNNVNNMEDVIVKCNGIR